MIDSPASELTYPSVSFPRSEVVNFPYKFSEQELAWMQAFSVLLAFIAFLLSVLAIYFTARTYWQKRGAFVRGSYIITSSSVATDYKYVNEVLLENLKDRPIVILGIYFHVSDNYLIELESFKGSPFILKPFEAVKRTYDPIDFYSFNVRRINLNALFENKYSKNRLVLATTDGKLIVKKPIPTWSPVTDWFNNHLRVTAQIHRVNFHGRGYGANILFLVDLFKDEELIRSIPLYPQESNYKWFRDLGGDEETLSSSDKVNSTFEAAITEGKIEADRIEIIDAKKTRDMIRNSSPQVFDDEPIIAEHLSWLYVNIVGRLVTWKRSREIQCQNRERKKTRAQGTEDQKNVEKY